MRRAVLVITLLAATTAYADDAARWGVSAEGDVYVLPFSLAGDPDYSLHVAVRPPSHAKWTFALGYFGGPYPAFYRDMIDSLNGVDNGTWDTRVDGVLLRALYFPAGRAGWFFGAHVGVLRWEHRNEDKLSVERSKQAVLWPAIGYRLFLYRETVFASVWTGPALLTPAFGRDREGPAKFSTAYWLPFGAVHVGFEI